MVSWIVRVTGPFGKGWMGSGCTLEVRFGRSGGHTLRDSVSPLPDILQAGGKGLIRTRAIWFPLRRVEHSPNSLPLHLKKFSGPVPMESSTNAARTCDL